MTAHNLKPSRLILRSLTYYWRTNAAVVLGVATTVAALGGALLVGDSVRGTLRDLVLQRLGRTDQVVVSAGFVREQLAEDIRTGPQFDAFFDGVCPIVVTQGFVTRQSGSGRAGQVRVYGVDDRFWRFHGIDANSGPDGNDALISTALARELDAQPGTTILVRVQRPSAISLESLFGRKEDLGQALRAVVRGVIPRQALGEFSLQAQQGEVHVVFLPLARLQRELGLGERVNTLLVSAKPESAAGAVSALEKLVRSETQLEDLGLGVRVLDARGVIALEAEGGLLNDAQANAAVETAIGMGLKPQAVFTYLANTLRSGSREIPYSLVTAMDLPASPSSAPALGESAAGDSDVPPILLNTWAARDLRVAAGDAVQMEYYVWEETSRLLTRTAEFRVAGVVPISTGDRDLVPPYPGITDSPSLGDWDPPFPIDLRRVRPVDEEYWENYRTTPKAFIPLAAGQNLWRSRYGAVSSIRFAPDPGQTIQPVQAVQREYVQRLRAEMDPLAMGLAVQDVRRKSLEASRGATDFGEYFVYFSFFLVVSALLLTALFFKLSVEQRAREVGLLRAVGFRPADVARLFLGEGLLLSVAGAAAGALGGIGYGYLIVMGLRTWWIDSVGTTALTLHISPVSLAGGALGGVVAAMACIWLTLRSLASVSERRLLAGQLAPDRSGDRPGQRKGRAYLLTAIGCAGIGAALMATAAAGLLDKAAAFFGAGMALLAACLFLFMFWFGLPIRKALHGQGWWPVSKLGLRNARYRPARSVLSVAMIASATFILISVDAFRRETTLGSDDPHSGVGGYSLLVKSLLPIVHDPNSLEGRQTLGLAELEPVTIEPFRVRPGDDASCLNLYEPKNPRILAPTDGFLAADRFAFRDSLASNAAESANPWLLLHREEPDGAVPVIADQNSMTYVLHRKLGEEILIPNGESPIRLRLVAALDDSIFQGELLMSEAQFRRLFPGQEGYRSLLVETPPERTDAVAAAIEEALTDFGADVTPTAERLAAFHQVENTYLSTFQMLGGLGLLLGTVGLGAVLLRNVLERRRELALLRALGYKQAHFFVLTIAENVLLLVSGLLAGTVCALLAITPAWLDRGGRLPAVGLALLLGGVLVSGLITSLVATAAALRSPLLAALREE